MLFQFCDTPLFSLLPNSPTLQFTCFISDRYCMRVLLDRQHSNLICHQSIRNRMINKNVATTTQNR